VPGNKPSGGGGNPSPQLPSQQGQRRLFGTHNGRRVNNVTDANRFDIDRTTPNLLIHLFSEDGTRLLYAVHIPNLRERPDVVIYRGRGYVVVDTTMKPPRYREAMTLHGQDAPITLEGHENGKTE
jgi:hypothetical protein